MLYIPRLNKIDVQVNKTIWDGQTPPSPVASLMVRLTPVKFYDGSDHNKYLV